MILQLFLLRTIGLPVWWYGRGLADFLKWLFHALSNLSKNLAIRIWMKNLFVPMYGETSFVGRAISFGIRLVMILARGSGMILYAIFLLVVFLAYLLLPILVFLGLVYHAQALI